MSTMPEPMVGEVWDVVLDPTIGHDQGGRRPALVISNDAFNNAPNGLHLVAPITGTNRGIGLHVAVAVDPSHGGLTKASVIMCDQARALSIQRFRRRRGVVDIELLHQIQRLAGLIIDR